MLSLLGLIIIINVDIIFRFVIGFGTMAVAKSKGYSGNWFWMGLFFGLLGLLIVWALHPANPYVERTREVTKTDIAGRGSWRCSCGLLNAYYVGTCTCGRGKPSNNFVGMRTISYSEQNYRKDQ